MPRQTQFLEPPIALVATDAPRVAALYMRSADYFLLQDGGVPTLADAHELFADVPPEKSPQDQIIWGWEDKDRLYAVAAILPDYPCAGTWYLGFLIVDPVRRGRGIGRSIYTAIENHAVANGAREIRLAVLETNEAGERFWRSLGFNDIRRVGPDTFKLRNHYRIELGRDLTCCFASGANQ